MLWWWGIGVGESPSERGLTGRRRVWSDGVGRRGGLGGRACCERGISYCRRKEEHDEGTVGGEDWCIADG